MKLELTLPALERLIGGDTEIEIGIRQSIAQAFATRYLKGVIDQSVEHRIIQTVRSECELRLSELLAKHIGVRRHENGRLIVQFEGHLQAQIDEFLKQRLHEILGKSLQIYESWVRTSINRYVENAMNETIARSIKAAVDARVKEVFQQPSCSNNQS